VRLRAACYITCTEAIKDDAGEVAELRATWDPESRGGSTPDERKVRGTIHWVSAKHAVPAKVRLYDRLFTVPEPDEDEEKEYTDFLNPDSLQEVDAFLEPSLAGFKAGDHVQFERVGYFTPDPDSTEERIVYNRTVALRDSWK
jgi:glutaminyl-tRNA synthetase